MNIECSNQMDTNGHSILFSDQNKKKRIQRRRSLLNYFKLKFKTPAKPRRDFHEKMTDQQSEIRRSFINSPSYISFVLYFFFPSWRHLFEKKNKKKRNVLFYCLKHMEFGGEAAIGSGGLAVHQASGIGMKKTTKQNKILYVM